jgi:hypothetical protein
MCPSRVSAGASPIITCCGMAGIVRIVVAL